MQANLTETTGNVLRKRVAEWLKVNKVSNRELSRRLQCEPNYITSYLGRPAGSWAIPKHPTLSRLLLTIGLTHEGLDALAVSELAAQRGALLSGGGV
jgi:hypothetical protein